MEHDIVDGSILSKQLNTEDFIVLEELDYKTDETALENNESYVVQQLAIPKEHYVSSFNETIEVKPSRRAFDVQASTSGSKKQPFPAIQSYIAAATLLSYYGYKDQSFELL